MPKWFARIFALLMVVSCIAIGWYAYQHEKLSYSAEDLRVSLETSQARERKQQFELNEVEEALPKAQEELADIQPKAEEAVRKEQELREERKVLRSDQLELQDQLESAQTAAADSVKIVSDAMDMVDVDLHSLEEDMSRALQILFQSISFGN